MRSLAQGALPAATTAMKTSRPFEMTSFVLGGIYMTEATDPRDVRNRHAVRHRIAQGIDLNTKVAGTPRKSRQAGVLAGEAARRWTAPVGAWSHAIPQWRLQEVLIKTLSLASTLKSED